MKFDIIILNSKSKLNYLVNKNLHFPAYLTACDFNVIIADWSTESHVMYNRDRRFVKELGAIIARFIDRLQDETKFDMDKLHIIGHSLGAHVCGVVGLNTRLPVGRITGVACRSFICTLLN